MVDVGEKPPTVREAQAGAEVAMRPETLRLILEGGLPKGDVLAVARVAGIMAAKSTPRLIPLCHPIALSGAAVDFEVDEAGSRILVRASARTTGPTGVEMEALTAAAVAALTIYDMCKAVDRGMTIGELCLLSKSGGRSGEFRRP
ncbi:MAG: cyclic pyranopterin monophosphate synthase MoaC [Firmicutes bacterium]|nr:cyclic pyranopterin monophosphate synthase MoaC [Bacillota bacterium]